MTPASHFNYCPSCGSPHNVEPTSPFTCTECRFVFYFSPTAASTAIIARADGKVLFITRAKEPAKGKLAFPGGFIDVGETAEEGLRRETREEVNLEISDIKLLRSHPNEYNYKGVAYPVIDFIFSAKVENIDRAQALDGVAEFAWRDPNEVALEDLAFPSLREGLRVYRNPK